MQLVLENLDLWTDQDKGMEYPKEDRRAWREIMFNVDDEHVSLTQDFGNGKEAWEKLNLCMRDPG
jgi:hypothetical protein